VATPSFRRRVIVLLVAALGLVQALTLAAVLVATHGNVRAALNEDLDVAQGVFARLFEGRFLQLGESVRVLAADFGFRKAAATGDGPTIESALENHAARAGADLAILSAPDGSIVASTRPAAALSANPAWQAVANRLRSDDHAADTVELLGAAYQLVAVPVSAPQRIAWLAMGFRVDDELAAELKQLTGLDVSFLGDGRRQHVFASTLAPAALRGLTAALGETPRAPVDGQLAVAGDDYLTRLQRLRPADDGVVVVLQKSLSEALVPYHDLALRLAGVFALLLAIAAAAGIALARSITEPMRQLAHAAARIGEGNYGVTIDIRSQDEIGQLAATLNSMQFEIAEREHRIVHQAHHDDLTGLPNRWLASDRLKGAIGRARRAGKPFSVAMLDLCRFKQINDTLGHHVGDIVLKETARRIVARARRSDTIARLGGDDFFLLLEGADLDAARAILGSLREVLTQPIELEGMSVSLDFRAGLTTFPDHGGDPAALMRRAEIAMYDAKLSHERIVAYAPGRDEGHLRQLAIVGNLPAALASGELSLYYQPQADMETGAIAHAEALVRWNHPQFGFIPPDEFITVIEQSGNISLLTAWVIDRAARQCRAWADRGLAIRVSVNLSALDLIDEGLPALLQQTLADYGLEPRQLALEITESAVMRDPKTALAVLGRLRAAGYGLSIDDFGTGYSSLAQLKRLPVDELKIDKSFVMHLCEGADDAVIVKSTIDLAHSLGLRVVAEGVETAAGWEALRRFGCDTAQGYLISKPLGADAFEDWVRALQRDSGRFLVRAA
jgi:diguanylate cyclase (GGDEF)-like protein